MQYVSLVRWFASFPAAELECSWVPGDQVSNHVIEEFKRGYSTKTTLQTTAYNQQLTSTISIENCTNGK